MVRRYRTPESVKKRIDCMLRNGKVILDHGIASYEFDHYDYENGILDIYYKNFDVNKTVRLYMRLTENNLRKPKKDSWGDYEWGEFVDCYWEKEYPSLLYMREYDSWR